MQVWVLEGKSTAARTKRGCLALRHLARTQLLGWRGGFKEDDPEAPGQNQLLGWGGGFKEARSKSMQAEMHSIFPQIQKHHRTGSHPRVQVPSVALVTTRTALDIPKRDKGSRSKSSSPIMAAPITAGLMHTRLSS